MYGAGHKGARKYAVFYFRVNLTSYRNTSILNLTQLSFFVSFYYVVIFMNSGWLLGSSDNSSGIRYRITKKRSWKLCLVT